MKLLAFSGKKQSGKTTAVDDIMKRVKGSVSVSFADYLKKIVCNCFNATDAQVNGSYKNKMELLDCNWTSREILQTIGTNWFRSIDPDCWVNAYKHELESLVDTFEDIIPGSFDEGLILTPDVRFPNEVNCIQEMGGHVIRFLRNPYDDKHESETALNGVEWDTGDMLAHPDQGFPELVHFDTLVDNCDMTVDEQNEYVWNLINEKEWI